MGETRKARVDIYARGCYLRPGKHNSKPGAGWGAVVNIDGGAVHSLSGIAKEDIHQEATYLALTKAIAFTVKHMGDAACYEMVLHTDQKEMHKCVKAISEGAGSHAYRNAPRLFKAHAKSIMPLPGNVLVTVEYRLNQPDTEYLTDPHDRLAQALATQEACKMRLYSQNKEISFRGNVDGVEQWVVFNEEQALKKLADSVEREEQALLDEPMSFTGEKEEVDHGAIARHTRMNLDPDNIPGQPGGSRGSRRKSGKGPSR